MRADEGTDADWQALRIYPDERYPELPYFDDDWMRFYYKDDRDDIVAYEIHEMCEGDSCSYRPSIRCAWHPEDCDCSLGACQGELDEQAMKENLEELNAAAREIL